MTLEVEVGSISIFKDVRFHSGHEVAEVFGIVEEISINCAASIVDQINAISVGVVNVARVHDHAKRVD